MAGDGLGNRTIAGTLILAIHSIKTFLSFGLEKCMYMR
jgi:hypothetical protein